MKKIMLSGLIVLFVLLFFNACSEDDKDDNGTEPQISYAYSLDQFVPVDAVSDLIVHTDEDSIECRDLFFFLPLADDGFSPRSHDYDDLDWTDWIQGFYIPDWDNRIFFSQYDSQGIGAYNVKDMESVCVFRGVKSIINDTLSVVFEFNAMTTEQVENYDGIMEDAIPLASFIPPHVTLMDSVAFTAADISGYTKMYYPEEIEAGYWLVDSQKTIFPDLNLPNSKKKFKFLKSLQFYGEFQEIGEYDNVNLAAEADADWSFTIPEDLSPYTGIPWE